MKDVSFLTNDYQWVWIAQKLPEHISIWTETNNTCKSIYTIFRSRSARFTSKEKVVKKVDCIQLTSKHVYKQANSMGILIPLTDSWLKLEFFDGVSVLAPDSCTHEWVCVWNAIKRDWAISGEQMWLKH